MGGNAKCPACGAPLAFHDSPQKTVICQRRSLVWIGEVELRIKEQRNNGGPDAIDHADCAESERLCRAHLEAWPTGRPPTK